MYTALNKKQKALLDRIHKAVEMENDGDNGIKDTLDYGDILDSLELLLYLTGRT